MATDLTMEKDIETDIDTALERKKAYFRRLTNKMAWPRTSEVLRGIEGGRGRRETHRFSRKIWRKTSSFVTLSTKSVTLTMKAAILLDKVQKRKIQVMVGAVVLGSLLGIGLRIRGVPLTHIQRVVVTLPGTIFTNLLKGLNGPLTITSLIVGITSFGEDMHLSARALTTLVMLIMQCSVMSAVLGIAWATLFGLGSHQPDNTPVNMDNQALDLIDVALDFFRNMIPHNLLRPMFQTVVTSYTVVGRSKLDYTVYTNLTERQINQFIADQTYINCSLNDMSLLECYQNVTENRVVMDIKSVEGADTMGIMVLAIAFSFTFQKLGPKCQYLVEVTKSMQEVMFMLSEYVSWISPFGMISLIASQLVDSDQHLLHSLHRVGYFWFTLCTGVMVYFFICMPCLYYYYVREYPSDIAQNNIQPIVTAFITASSTATMPVAMRSMVLKDNINPRVVKMVSPIASFANFNGKIMLNCIIVIYLGNTRGIVFTPGEYVLLVVLSIMDGITIPGIPDPKLVTLELILVQLNIPPSDVSKVQIMFWVADKVATVQNVFGDAYIARIVEHVIRDELIQDLRSDIDDDDEQKDTKLSDSLHKFDLTAQHHNSAQRSTPISNNMTKKASRNTPNSQSQEQKSSTKGSSTKSKKSGGAPSTSETHSSVIRTNERSRPAAADGEQNIIRDVKPENAGGIQDGSLVVVKKSGATDGTVSMTQWSLVNWVRFK